ncbi:hypothetical protein D9619_012223 [Psilocybe cf. subviscida]|uniref:Uncharacterized protein n=1 Tax=Psilocybe cf. subviscida TaxID=2480587 RepID=A0A8H5B7D7_9AGAR|nr:hypothetical protein D9619_012223 [Psilocybe cf. subviscida]
MKTIPSPLRWETVSTAVFAATLFFNPCTALIDRKNLVSRFNPTRNASSLATPMQVGNGNFAFGADVTGLQTFQPFGILSSWGWKNDSFPPGVTQADIDAYHGVSWLNHGRPVEYDFGGGNPIEQWLISNPNRVNLGRVGLLFLDGTNGSAQSVMESDLRDVKQELDLWSGVISSSFTFDGEEVTVAVACAQETDAVGVTVSSTLVRQGRLGLFIDFPWNDGSAKFSAPFVGNWSIPERHTSALTRSASKEESSGQVQAEILHKMDNATFYTAVAGSSFSVTRQSPAAHRYSIRPSSQLSSTFAVSFSFSANSTMAGSQIERISSPEEVVQSSRAAWAEYWSNSGFVDVMTGSTDQRAEELQRRIILSRYLMRVNEAGDTPPQESGLTNNGWYG